MIHKRVVFKGEEYWYHKDDNGFCEAMLSPIDHYDDSGNLLANPLSDCSYAVIEGNNIVRFQEKIGNISELEDVL